MILLGPLCRVSPVPHGQLFSRKQGGDISCCSSVCICLSSSLDHRANRVGSACHSTSTVVQNQLSHGRGGGFPDEQSPDCWLQLCTDSCISVPCAIWLGKERLRARSERACASPVPCLSGTALLSPRNPPGEASYKTSLRLTIPAATKWSCTETGPSHLKLE